MLLLLLLLRSVGCIIGACGIAITIDAMYRIMALDNNPHATNAQYVAAVRYILRVWLCACAEVSVGALGVLLAVKQYTELAASLVIGNLGGMTEKSPWVAVIPDTVSIKQRGQCVMVVSWCNTVLQIFGGAMGYMVGQKLPCFGRHPCFSYMDMYVRPVIVVHLLLG